MLDAVGELNKLAGEAFGDPEINTRIAQYEMAFRMQASVPELTDLSKESKQTIEMYGIDEKNEDGGYAPIVCRAAARRTGRAFRAAVPPRVGSTREFAVADSRAVQGR